MNAGPEMSKEQREATDKGWRNQPVPEQMREPPDTELEEENPDWDGGVFTRISVDDFYDLLMEQQEQM